ncbi:hypothetical protein GGX14DRAFT_407558 [Mycena pura]|uniref:Uncharacterized protein n=1 Tax=Mycena pura TaxID=153505 RepID=A0AAD6UMQ5_9AGAR|nr:hypothetical protein GGX14DRAFT_407558 [Mycena pura]
MAGGLMDRLRRGRVAGARGALAAHHLEGGKGRTTWTTATVGLLMCRWRRGLGARRAHPKGLVMAAGDDGGDLALVAAAAVMACRCLMAAVTMVTNVTGFLILPWVPDGAQIGSLVNIDQLPHFGNQSI